MSDPIPPITAVVAGNGTRLGDEYLAALRAGGRLAGIDVHGAASTDEATTPEDGATPRPPRDAPSRPVGGLHPAPAQAHAPGRAPAAPARPVPCGPAMDVHVLTVHVRQLDALLAVWGGRVEEHLAAGTPRVPAAGAPASATPTPAAAPTPAHHPLPAFEVPDAATPWRPSPVGVEVRSATGVIGPLQQADVHAVSRAALTGDHTGAGAKVFAVQVHPGPVDLVVVQADWSAGLPPGRRGAAAVAAALDAGLAVTARPGHPPVAAEVSTVPDGTLVVRLHGPGDRPVRVAPVLADAGFRLLVQPGWVTGGGPDPVPVVPAGPGEQLRPSAVPGAPVPGGGAPAGERARAATADPRPDGFAVARAASAFAGLAGLGGAGGGAPVASPVHLDRSGHVVMGVLSVLGALLVTLVGGWLDLGAVTLLVAVALVGGALAVVGSRAWAGALHTLAQVAPPPPPPPPVTRVHLEAHRPGAGGGSAG